MTWRKITWTRPAVVVLALAVGAAALAAGKWEFKPSAAERRALASITPASLQAHLSFLSADPLEGRGAGTTGLDVAAEYIAAQFRLAGLKPIGDDGYFQVTPRIRLTPASDGYQCRLSVEGRVLDVPSRQFALLTAAGGNAAAIRAIGIDDAPVVKVPFGGPFPEQMADAGRSAVITEFPAMPADQAARTAFLDRRREFLDPAHGVQAGAGRRSQAGSGQGDRLLRQPPARRSRAEGARRNRPARRGALRRRGSRRLRRASGRCHASDGLRSTSPRRRRSMRRSAT